jgi:hypothetical protein
LEFSLRLLTEADVPALQRVYDRAQTAFTQHFGAPAGPEQAALDFVQALYEPGRYQFGIYADGELIGLADCKLDAEVEGQAHLGRLVLAEPYNQAALGALALRILFRWLTASFAVRRLATSVPAHVPADIAFWQEQGFNFTGEQYRREIGGFAPRFLIMEKDLDANTSGQQER